MKPLANIFLVLLLAGSMLSFPKIVSSQSTIPAFPGAEGFAANALGGRGGKVYEVTNLNDSGTGSLRECTNATGPRTCVFKVGGTIPLTSTLRIANPYITIAGQTAPGGIALRAASTSLDPAFLIITHDVVVRYLTVRYTPLREGDALTVTSDMGTYDTRNVIIDHSSFSWGTDQVLALAGHDILFQRNIVSEGLNCSTHVQGCHSKGPMLSGNVMLPPNGTNISFHHNLIANNRDRNPLVQIHGPTDIVNNVAYNTPGVFSYADMHDESAMLKVNYINNLAKAGPGTANKRIIQAINASTYGAGIYVEGNIDYFNRTNNSMDNALSLSTTNSPPTYPYTPDYRVMTRYPAPSVTTQTCNSTTSCAVYDSVIADVGNNKGLDANGSWIPRQDAVDKRIIAEVKNKGGKYIDAPAQPGCPDPALYPTHACVYLTSADYTKYGINDPLDSNGYPLISGGTGYGDSDHDGMSDVWEQKYGFNVSNSSDGNLDADGDGYTNLEEFLNGTNPKDGVIITPTPGATKPGDANNDGFVNETDYQIWLTNYGKLLTGPTSGDFNSSGKVDGVDYTIWLLNFGK